MALEISLSWFLQEMENSGEPLTYRDVAELLGVSEAVVKSWGRSPGAGQRKPGPKNRQKMKELIDAKKKERAKLPCRQSSLISPPEGVGLRDGAGRRSSH